MNIRVGDLVMVVRGHECDLGRTFLVTEIVPEAPDFGWHCPQCNKWGSTRGAFAFRNSKSGAPLSWLRKIAPLTEPEPERIAEEA